MLKMQFIRFGFLFILLSSLTASSQVFAAQGGFPASASPGAVMWGAENQMFLQRTQPYLFRPITPQDVSSPADGNSPITIEKGVLPPEHNMQGVITTPEGQTVIGPPTP